MNPKINISNLGIRFNLEKYKNNSIKQYILNKSEIQQRRSFWAIRNFNLSLRAGDSLGIMGNNGAGKSTLLKTIAGIYAPDEGQINVTGSISLLSINKGFEPDLTGIENIYLKGSIFCLEKNIIDKKLNDIIEFADIGDFIYQNVRTYSSGMVARLGFAVAINLKPDILLIDEVLAVGDKNFREKCQNEINKILEESKIVIIVTHDENIAQKYCNQILNLG